MMDTQQDDLQTLGTIERYGGLHGEPETPEMPAPRQLDFLDVLLIFARGKRTILAWIAAGIIVAVIITLRAPVLYKATGIIMPPQQEQSSSALLSQLGALGAIAGVGGGDLTKNPADLYVAILETNLVMSHMVDRFHLEDVYGIKDHDGAVGKLHSRSKFLANKIGLITISVEDKDPKRAQMLVSGFTNELFEENNRLVTGSAGQRREFYQKQLAQEKDRLADAEVALKQTQLTTGVLQLGGQAQNLIGQESSLEANITAHEVQLAALMSSSTSENPDVVRLRTELAGLREQLKQLQHGTGGDMLTQREFPNAGLEYIRRERDVQYHQTLYDLLARQLEAARIDEAKASPDVQVLDPPIVPKVRSWPKPLLFIAAGIFLGAVCGCMRIAVVYLYDYADTDPRLRDRFRAAKRALRPMA